MYEDEMFEWDEEKADSNIRKHGVAFREARTVFRDRAALSFPDTMNSDEEQRWITIGRSDSGGILLVSSTDRGENVRIISARRATRKECERYERGE